MSKNLHVSADGVVRKCSTTPEKCPVKGLDGEKAHHFSNDNDAREYVEKYMSGQYGNKPLRKITPKTKMLSELDEVLSLSTTEFQKGRFKKFDNLSLDNRQKKLLKLIETGKWSEASDRQKLAAISTLTESHYHIGSNFTNRKIHLKTEDRYSLTSPDMTIAKAEQRLPILQKLQKGIRRNQAEIDYRLKEYKNKKNLENKQKDIAEESNINEYSTNEDYFKKFITQKTDDYDKNLTEIMNKSYRPQRYFNGGSIDSGWDPVYMESGDVFKVKYWDKEKGTAEVYLNNRAFRITKDKNNEWNEPVLVK